MHKLADNKPARLTGNRVSAAISYAGLALLLAGIGCTTPSTVATRRQEKASAYAALSAEMRAAVDEGRLKVGMSEEAVYIAWGKPAQVLRSGDATGESTLWLYHGTTSDNYLVWRYQTMLRPDGSTFLDRTLDRSLDVREYVAAELTFQDGRLKSWRTLAQPPARTIFVAPGP